MTPPATATRVERWVWGVCLVLAPALLAASAYFGINDAGVVGGTILVYSFALWIPALLALFNLVRTQMPRYAVFGSLIAVYACVAGTNFGMESIYLEVFRNQGGALSTDALREAMGPAAVLVLLLPGLLFPLNTLVLAVALLWKKVVPRLAAASLAVGAVAFPVARIPEIQLVAHVGDILLLLPMMWIGWMYLTRSDFPPAASSD